MMTHTPPVPPGNTSPYPIQEPPHPPAPPVSTKPAEEWAEPAKRGWSIGKIVGAAAGVGAIAIGVAAVLFPRDNPPATKKKKRKN
jgi:hypothetical protein